MKNNFITYILIIISVIFFFFVQISNFNPLPIIHIPINYLIVISICISIFSSLSQRIFISLFCGLLIDLWFSSCSFYTLSLLIVNNLIATIVPKTMVGRLFILLSASLGTILIELINASLLGFCLFTTPFNPFVILQKNIIKVVIGNTIFSLIVFSVIKSFLLVKNSLSNRNF